MKRWLLSQRWDDMLFAHWPVKPEALGPLLPAGVEPDVRDACRRARGAARAWLDSRVECPDVRARGWALRRVVPHPRHVESTVRDDRPRVVRTGISPGAHDRDQARSPHPLRERVRPGVLPREVRADRSCDSSAARLARALAGGALPSLRVARPAVGDC